MSIQKITQADIDTHGVKSLPSRPSAPTLYSGKALTAEELKEAFDRLPTLIAERFNALLASTGLFDGETPADSLAELIATGIAPTHSLKAFFLDVLDGNLALYLNAGGGRSLADVLSDLSQGLAELQRDASVVVEGDGDILTHAEMQGTRLTLRRELSSKALLEDARAYTDARVANLDNAAKGILYSYPEETRIGNYTQVAENALANTALLSFGAVPPLRENYFPEPILSTYRGSSLTITWDEERGELVLNGTLRAADSPLRLATYTDPVPYDDMMLMCFYRSGSVSTSKARIAVVDGDGTSIPSPLLEEDASDMAMPSAAAFSHIEMTTTADTVFEDYRFNLLLCDDRYFSIKYAPYNSRFGFALPKKLISQTPNLWGGDALDGEGYVSFSVPEAPQNCQYVIGFLARPYAASAKPYCFLEVMSGDEAILSKKISATRFSYVCIEPTSPVTEVRVYAKETPEASVGHSLVLDQIYVSVVDYWTTVNTLSYTPPARCELLFPETLSRFEEMFIGIGDSSYNYFDFKTGMFLENDSILTLDASLALEADASIAGRFSAPVDATEELLTKNVYLPSALFAATADESCSERIWFTEGRVHIQSTLFAHMSAAEVKQFLRICPIEVVYAKPSVARHGLTKEETAFGTPPILHTGPLAYLYFSRDGVDTVRCKSKMQFQIKES